MLLRRIFKGIAAAVDVAKNSKIFGFGIYGLDCTVFIDILT